MGFLCTEVMGDEYIESFWRCGACGHYTRESYHDRFMGEADSQVRALTPEQGEEQVRVARSCPTPGEKRCPCPAHEIARGGW